MCKLDNIQYVSWFTNNNNFYISKIAGLIHFVTLALMNMEFRVFLPKVAKYASVSLNPWKSLWKLYLALIHNLGAPGMTVLPSK